MYKIQKLTLSQKNLPKQLVKNVQLKSDQETTINIEYKL